MTHPVVIVGAGVVGCGIARDLGARGVPSLVLDHQSAGAGATHASAGILAPYIEAHERGPLLDLGVRSLALYDDWIAAVSRDAGEPVEYRRIGTLEIALDPDHAASLQRAAAAAPSRMQWHDRDAVRAIEPALGANDGGLLVPAHGYVSAPQLTTALARAAQRHGATLQRARVTRIERGSDLMRVHTSDGAFEAQTVVVAAGSWAGEIAVDGAPAAPVYPVRGQLLHLEWTGRPLGHILWGPECYIVPHVDGTLLVGATVEDVGFDERATAAGVRDLLDAACELLPEGGDASFLGVRVGLRPGSPDELPIIGEGDVAGVVYAAGHFRNGVLLAPLTARIVADLIVDGRRDPALDILSPRRFAP